MGGREGGQCMGMGHGAHCDTSKRGAGWISSPPDGQRAAGRGGCSGGGARAVEGSGGRGPVRAWRLNDMRDKKKTLGADIWHAGNRSTAVQADYRLKLHVGLW